jgi:hypothetical protein
MFGKLKHAWKRDPLAALGVGSAAVAFLLWAMPSPSFGINLSQYRCDNGMSGGSAYSLVVVQVISGCLDNRYDRVIGAEGWFTLERLPAIVISLALGAFLFFVSVRRRGRVKQKTKGRTPQTLAVAIVSAAISALVVTGAGLLLVNQVPRKSVFQTIYRDPTPTPQPFLTPSPSPSPTPTPKPTKAPLQKLSDLEKGTLNEIKDTIIWDLNRRNNTAWNYTEHYEIKASYTNTQFVYTIALEKWARLEGVWVSFKFKSRCVYPRMEGPYMAVDDTGFVLDSKAFSNLLIINVVEWDEFDSSFSNRYPHEPEKWMAKRSYKSRQQWSADAGASSTWSGSVGCFTFE